jgi:hypothetical protein
VIHIEPREVGEQVTKREDAAMRGDYRLPLRGVLEISGEERRGKGHGRHLQQEDHIAQDERVIGALDETKHQKVLRPDDTHNHEA